MFDLTSIFGYRAPLEVLSAALGLRFSDGRRFGFECGGVHPSPDGSGPAPRSSCAGTWPWAPSRQPAPPAPRRPAPPAATADEEGPPPEDPTAPEPDDAPLEAESTSGGSPLVEEETSQRTRPRAQPVGR